MNNIYQSIVRPYVTEKSSNSQDQGKYTFLVHKKATKVDIKIAIKQIYNVEVANVNIINTSGKTRLLRGRFQITKRPDFKKAIITVKGDKKIDFNKIKEKK